MRNDRVLLSRTAVASIGATFLLMGLVVAAYGPLLEHLTRRFGVSLPIAGATISVHFAGSLLGVLAAMRATEKVSGRLSVMVATGVVSVGCAAVAIAPAWPAFVAAVFVVGVGFGGLVLGLNQLVAYSQGPRRAALLNALNGAYSAGAVAGPILVAAFAREHFSLLYLAGAAASVVLIPGAAGISGRLPVAVGRPGRPERLVLIFVAAFVLYVGVENGTGGWMTAHLESAGLHSRDAAAYTSGFWLALVIGRLLITLTPPRVPEPAIVLGGAAVAAVALLAASIGAIAPIAYFVTGLAIAPIFPTGIVWLAKLRPGDSRATSWLFPAASIGGVAGPGAIGLVVAGLGVHFVPLALAVVAAGTLSAFWLAKQASRA